MISTRAQRVSKCCVRLYIIFEKGLESVKARLLESARKRKRTTGLEDVSTTCGAENTLDQRFLRKTYRLFSNVYGNHPLMEFRQPALCCGLFSEHDGKIIYLS